MSSQIYDTHNEQDSDQNNPFTEDYNWLGIIFPEDVQSNKALITPLGFFDEDDTWCSASKYIQQRYFPNNGKVVVFIEDIFASKVGKLCCFWPERSPILSSPEHPWYSHYRVSKELELASCAQILDWTSKAKDSLELPQLLEQGIEATNCFTSTIYIRYQHYLYGPIKLERNAEVLKPREYIQCSNTGGPSLFVSVYELSENEILTLDGEAHQLFVFYENKLASPLSQEDWSLPQVVIKRILQASREVPPIRDDVSLIDNRIRTLARLSSQDGSAVLRIEEATLKRGQHIVDIQMRQLQDMQGFIEYIVALPAEHPLIRVVRQQEILLRSADIEQKVEAQLHDEREKLQHIQNTVREAEALLETLKKAATVAEESRKQALAVEREVQQHLARMREEPTQILATLQIAASLFPLLRQHEHNEQYAITPQRVLQTPTVIEYNQGIQQKVSLEAVVQWNAITSREMAPDELRELKRKFWLRFAQQNRVKSEEVQICAALLLAGCIPMVDAFIGESLIRAVAQAIAGGRMWSVPIPLTALSPLDIFGKIDSDSRMFIPAVGGLADIILQARMNPQDLALVLLEGIDRVPALPVLVPLLRQYIQARQNVQQVHALNLFHLRAISADDPYVELVQFTWPRNLLLAVTCDDDDSSSISLPEVYTSWFAHMRTKRNTSSSSPTSKHSSFVPFDTWHRWEELLRQETLSGRESGWELGKQIAHTALVTLSVNNPDDVIENIWPSDDTVSNT